MTALKRNIHELGIFDGMPIFKERKSTSNLYRPSIDAFLEYSRLFYGSKQYTNNGELVFELEKRLALFHGTEYCVAFNSGFWALVLAIREISLPGKRNVIIPSLTYRRLADVVTWAGLNPVFCDINEKTLSVSRETIEFLCDEDTALVLAVHPIVNVCDVYGVVELCEQRNIPLLFDSVESVYETVEGVKTGGFGQAECFSLHASKLINGFEGGYLTTNDENLYERLKLLRAFGFNGPDYIVGLGINAKMNEMHAAMALSSLDEIELLVEHNKKIYKHYETRLEGAQGLNLIGFNELEQTSYKNILVEVVGVWKHDRDFLVDILNAEGILARAYYNPPLHCRWAPRAKGLDRTEQLSKRYILMPCGHHVDIDDVDVVIDFLIYLYDNYDVIMSKFRAEKGSYGRY